MRSSLAIAAVLALLPLAAGNPEPPGPKIEFPEVKGFTRGKINTFPQASLGYSIAYSAPGITATLYVYNKGLKEIPGGAKSEVVKDEMKQIAADLEAARKQGLYKSVKDVGEEEVVSLGKGKEAPLARKRQFIVERPKDGEKLSDAYITGYKDHFIKLRITYEPEGKQEAEKKIAALLEGIGSVLK